MEYDAGMSRAEAEAAAPGRCFWRLPHGLNRRDLRSQWSCGGKCWLFQTPCGRGCPVVGMGFGGLHRSASQGIIHSGGCFASSGWLGPLTGRSQRLSGDGASRLSKKCPQIARSATDIYNACSGAYAERTVVFTRTVFESSYAVFSHHTWVGIGMVTVNRSASSRLVTSAISRNHARQLGMF
jgi:hypothetical protein